MQVFEAAMIDSATRVSKTRALDRVVSELWSPSQSRFEKKKIETTTSKLGN